jgi:uncharacterized membrane protein YecN with MAPEG domain
VEQNDGSNQNTVTVKTMEIIVALLLIAVAGIVIKDSIRLGVSWGDQGPESGFFPFRIGIVMLLASAAILIKELVSATNSRVNFVERSNFIPVLQVLFPTIGFVAATGFLGIYVSSALFLALFMMWLGKYPIHKALLSGVACAVFLFWLFELTFMVPLPKGPLEAALGF